MGNIDTNGNDNVIGSTNIQVSGSGAIVTRFFQGKAEQRAQRERHAMLELVRTIWVEGVLEKSLYAEILTRLGLEEQPGAGERLWNVLLQTPNQPNRMLPPGTPLMEVFDAVNGSLLILGEPGAGKTTMLLELARDTIARAEQDAALPIPVVFNLSSWADPQQTLADWLVAELRTKYYAPKETAQKWVKHGELLLLLDGLDEIRPENRETCIQAINDFRQAHGLTMPLVVCCRTADYKVLGTKLQPQGTVIVQPLTPQQIEAYFDRMGEKLAAVYQAWKQDSVLQELVRQPLMLNILTLAYQDLSAEGLASMHGTLETRRKHLFDTYIHQLFTRPVQASKPLYTSEEATCWLAWLARKMSEQGQSIFFLEQMHRNWLRTSRQQRLHVTISRLAFGLVFGLILGLVGKVVGDLVFGWPYRQGLGLSEGLFFGLAVGLGHKGKEESTELLKWLWEKILSVLVWGLLWGLVSGMAVCLLVGLFSELYLELFFKLLSGLAGGLAFGLAIGLFSGPTETGIGIIPNQEIRQFTKNAIRLWLVWGVIGGIFGGLISGLVYGGTAVISHYTLRFLLCCQDHTPWGYIRFLDYAAERLFLRKVGGGYIFVHRMVMEHFASLSPGS